MEKREYVEQVEGNNTYLLSLMENILNIADMDSRVWEMPREEIEVDACCKECIEGFRPELKPGICACFRHYGLLCSPAMAENGAGVFVG